MIERQKNFTRKKVIRKLFLYTINEGGKSLHIYLTNRKDVIMMSNILAHDENFKILFGSEENISVLTEFLSTILEIPYAELKGKVRFLNQHLDEEVKEVSQSVDVLVELPDKILHIEMNTRYHPWTKRRNFIYAARIYSRHFSSSKQYQKNVNYIQINLNGYAQKDFQEIQKKYYIMTEKYEKWVEDFEIREINIPYCTKLWYDGDRRGLVEWASIFGCKDEKELGELMGEIPMEDEARRKLEKSVDRIIEEKDIWWD